jgi:hypothetical protein
MGTFTTALPPTFLPQKTTAGKAPKQGLWGIVAGRVQEGAGISVWMLYISKKNSQGMD